MKFLKVRIPFALLPVIVFAQAGNVSWFSAPKAAPNGWYWMYDDTESGPPFIDPLMPPMPSFYSIHNTGNKIAPYNDEPYKYTMPDSFWFYGIWYEPGDTLYISPDGWVSFDNTPGIEEGFPDPPANNPPFPVADAPNALIAPLWQDHDPARGPPSDYNRVYYEYDNVNKILIVEWYWIEGHASGNVFTFEVMLALGGQDKLVTEGPCGVVFSYHFIHFMYNYAPSGWDADNLHDPPAVGIEDQEGTYGIYYQGELVDGRVIRMGYKKQFTHDMEAYAFLSPGKIVLRYTPIEPKVVVRNIGKETEHFTATLDIYDESGEQVYHVVMGTYDHLPGLTDTMIAPCWEPGELGSYYDLVLITDLDRDECHYNDTHEVKCLVHCDDTFSYDWNYGDVWGWGVNSGDYHFMTFYGVDNGVLVTGGRTWLSDVYGTGYPAVEVLEATSGCGATGPSNVVAQATCETFQVGWNEAWFGGFGVFVKSGNPGNIWAAWTPSATPSGYFAELGQHTWPAPGSCYAGGGPGRGAYLDPDFHWGGYSGDFYTPANELFVHLGFGSYPLSPRPSAPCYDGGIHDVVVFGMCYYLDYIEAGVAITPEIAIANNGRQTEPLSDSFPVKFFAIDQETSDTLFTETTMVGHIGWLGDDTDDPDTLFVAVTPWIPEGRCDETYPFVDYELIRLVNLGAVGPDSSDHCPYNDTVRQEVICLWSHDVGVTGISWPEEPPYGPGSTITVTATVENFGYNDEHDIPVRLEISDAETGELLWHALENISFLDWRGNVIDNPYTTDIVFPAYSVLSEDTFRITCRTELEGDLCSADDEKTGIASIKESGTLPVQFVLEVAGGVITDACRMSFAVPHATVVNLGIYDAGGRLVKTLNNDVCLPGYHTKTWNGLDNAGRRAAAGIYLIRMQTEEFSSVRKIVLLK
jgi:hypothetical protein